MNPMQNKNISQFSYFDSIFYHSKQNCILIMDESGKVIGINPAFTQSFGYSENDILGKSASILYTEKDLENGMFDKELKEVKTLGESSDNNFLVNKDGTQTFVCGESTLAKDKDGNRSIVKVIQNIQQRKVSEMALGSLNDFNENILASIEDVVVVLNSDLKLVKANHAFLKLFKSSKPDLENLNIGELIKPYDSRNLLLNAIQNTIKTKKEFSNKQIEMEVTPGQKRVFDLSCKPLPNEADNNVLLIVHDITIHKQLEREREDIMGFVAHELRNPLANVILCNEVMSEAIENNETQVMKDMLQKINNNVTRLQKMITELYEATRVNSGFLKLEPSIFHFGEMVKEAVETIEVLQPSYNIMVKGSTDFMITADRYRLIQVVTNFLSNGIKYSNGKTDVLLSVNQDDKTATVSVQDEGLGIPKEMLPFIFERFFRVEKTRDIEGIGLGLYLCQQIILAHNGRIWSESKEGEGSTFYFSIPLDFTRS